MTGQQSPKLLVRVRRCARSRQFSRRMPVVLTREEVQALLRELHGVHGLIARLLYGSGLRLMEGMRLRAKDVDGGRAR